MALQVFAQTQNKLVQKLSEQLCDSMSSKLASVDDVEKYFNVIQQSDSSFFKKMLQSPDFENLARSISSDQQKGLKMPLRPAVRVCASCRLTVCARLKEAYR